MVDNTIVKARGVIMSFRRGRARTHETQVLCKFTGFDDAKSASKLIGHEMEWTSPMGIAIRGRITKTHGIKGVVRVQLSRGHALPGQSLGNIVTIVK